MINKTRTLIRALLTAVILLTSLASTAGIGYAQTGAEGLAVSVTAVADCGDVQFTISWENGLPPYLFQMNYGDGDATEILTVTDSSLTLNHTYTDQGSYEWTVQVAESAGAGLSGTTTDILILEGPTVALTSTPFPPLVLQGVDDGLIEFSAAVVGGRLPYIYQWDANGDGLDDGTAGDSASSSFTFTEIGKFQARVTVTDACAFSSQATLPVVVSNPEDVCQPTAQKIADGVNTLFPDQSGDLYTCDEIYSIFDNEGEENNLGFGRMWKAYNLALSMEELSWEDILAWHLNVGGWGALLQLDRFAELLEDHSLPDLMALVISEDYSLGDVRTAVRSVTRYEADFEDALARIAEGATPGELTQFYKLAGDLEADPAVLDKYLTDGLTLSELKHSANFADRMNVDWTEVADARSSADSWGDLNQAYHLATDEISAAEILIIGVQDYKESLRGEPKADQEEQKAQQQEEKSQNTAEKLAEQFSAEFGEVMNLYNGECEGEWACVRASLKDQQRTMAEGFSEKDYQNALQIGSKYGFTEEEVLAYHKDYCGEEDWACTRAYFRNSYMETKETGKSHK